MTALHHHPPMTIRRAGARHRWLLPAAVTVFVLLAATNAWTDRYELEGPTAAAGFRVRVSVRDAGLGWSADFRSDVRVVAADGARLLEWKDRHGQGMRGGPEKLRDSMQWTSPRTLTFASASGRVELMVP